MHNSAPLIGVLAPLTGGFYFGSIIDGIAGVAQAAGAQVLAIQTNEAGFTQPDPLAAPHFAVPLGWRHIDGWVIIVDAVDEAYLWQIKDSGKPLVMISHQVAGLDCPRVVPDNWRGIRDAVDHLVAHGHRRIGFAGWLAQADIRQRHAAYREALLSHGIEPDPALLFAADDNVEAGGHAAARRMLAAGLPSTAVVAATDCNAIGIMEALAAAGYALPRDQAVVGFDDIEAAAYLKPALSSIRQPFDAIGRAAAALLLDQLAGLPVPALTAVPTALVLRESCGCARAAAARPDCGPNWQSRLAERLVASCPPPDQPASHAGQAQRAAAAIAAAMAAGLTGRPLEDGALDQEWAALFHPKLQPDGVEQAVRELRLAGRSALGLPGQNLQAAGERLDDFVAQAARDLSRLQIRAQFADMSYLWSLVRSQYRISMDLLRSHESDIRALDWLTWTSARVGCFGMWSGDELEIAGIFQREGGRPALLGQRVAADSFPPPDLLGPAGAGEVVFLFPVRSKARDWGVLAVLGPVEAKFATGRESFNQWSALLAVGLDQQRMLQSLRDGQRDLAQAYQRERDLAESLRASEERYALAARAANDGLWDWDLLRGEIYYSARWQAMLGYAEGALGPSPEEWLGRIHPADRPGLEAELAAHLAGAAPTLEYEHRVLGQSGDYRWMLCRALAVRDAEGRATRLVGSLTDITDRKALEERLLHDALYDLLTGLPNRKLFLERLQQAIEYAHRRQSYRFAVLFLDLDGFKVINDSLGHFVGDRLLMAVAERLKANLRVTDTAARFGGDEFAILLGDFNDVGEIPRIAERIQSQLSSPFDLGDHSVVVTASIGIAISMDQYETAEEVLRDADIAMYRAKTAGKRNHAIFDMTMHQGALSRLRIEGELRRAIEQGELSLHYQPIVRLDTGQPAGVEALVRWEHPERGRLAPGEFLPIAEETGLIIPIGAWTLRAACQRLAAWSAQAGLPPLTISVNLSHKQFWHPGLLDQLDAALAAAPLAEPRLLRLEITEGVIMSNPEAGQAILAQLCGRGIDLHIDDFGTGYSSLEALHRFPIQGLKIDRSFVAGLGRDQRSSEITRTIIMLGQRLGMEVIAEGIETDSQRALLRELGCAYGQGYLLARPLAAEDLAALLAAPALAG